MNGKFVFLKVHKRLVLHLLLIKNVSSFIFNSVCFTACFARQILTQNPILYLFIIQSLILYLFPLNLLLLCFFIIFVFPPHFQILVMLWFKNKVLVLNHLNLVPSQIPLHNIHFVTQNS